MSDETLLAHVSNRLGHGNENLAMEALEYVLRHPQVADAFGRHLRGFEPALPPLARYRTQVTGDGDSGFRDLVGSTAANTTPLVAEVKFEAPLTPNQPVTYLKALLDLDEPCLLLFLALTTKLSQLWPRLIRRCAEADIELTPDADGRPAASVGNVTMAATSWAGILDDLAGIPLSSENQQVLGEIVQLRGLCAREDREGFTPFGSAFLEGKIGPRLLQIDSLLIEATGVLRHMGTAVTKRYKWSAGQGWFGKYFTLGGRESLLHANFTRWGTQADTPLWLRGYPKSHQRVADALAPLRAMDPPQFVDDDGRLLMPIHLPADGDRDACLESIVDRGEYVPSLLAEVPPLSKDDPSEITDDDEDVTYEAE